MEEKDIDEVVEGFVRGARLAKETGWDGVEIHASHGYLLAQFMSPKVRRRLSPLFRLGILCMQAEDRPDRTKHRSTHEPMRTAARRGNDLRCSCASSMRFGRNCLRRADSAWE